MKILELFAGTCSFSKVAEQLGHVVFTSDIDARFGTDYTVDIMDFDYSKVFFGVPDVIWASPPCTYFSVASIGTHWNCDHTPKTAEAVKGMAIAKKTLEIIAHFQALNPALIFFIENPRGKLRKMDFMAHLPRHTVTYCKYGDTRMKPTDVWSNSKTWTPRPICKNGDTCHVRAPRGSRTGTQGLKGGVLRSVVPPDLCKEILLSI